MDSSVTPIHLKNELGALQSSESPPRYLLEQKPLSGFEQARLLIDSVL